MALEKLRDLIPSILSPFAESRRISGRPWLTGLFVDGVSFFAVSRILIFLRIDRTRTRMRNIKKYGNAGVVKLHRGHVDAATTVHYDNNGIDYCC